MSKGRYDETFAGEDGLVDKTPVALPLRDKINTGNVKLVPPGGLSYEHDKRSAWKSRCPLKFDMCNFIRKGC